MSKIPADWELKDLFFWIALSVIIALWAIKHIN
jgi:hypothetical protein